MKAGKWNLFVLGGTAGILGIIVAVTVIIDPFLHYHKPLEGLEYPLKEERYQNDGITRHYEYDALITGTSMTQNFKTSEFDALWDAKAVKAAYSGASYKEVNDNVRRALSYNGNIRYIVRSLDANMLIYPAEQDEYEGYPEYFFDENPFNDVEYLLNKEVVPKTLAVLNYTRAGNQTPDMDEYGNWNAYKTFGRNTVLSTCIDLPEAVEEQTLTEEDYKNIRENVQQNIIDTALDYPDVTFYLFFPPYSICYWNALVDMKQIDAQLEAEQLAVEMLLGAENIRVFAFAEEIDLTSNLDNYTDTLHYGEWVNTEILEWMRAGEHELTEENYREYFRAVQRLYTEYDYSQLD